MESLSTGTETVISKLTINHIFWKRMHANKKPIKDKILKTFITNIQKVPTRHEADTFSQCGRTGSPAKSIG